MISPSLLYASLLNGVRHGKGITLCYFSIVVQSVAIQILILNEIFQSGKRKSQAAGKKLILKLFILKDKTVKLCFEYLRTDTM